MYAPKLNQTANKKSLIAQKKDTSSSSNLLLQQFSRMGKNPNPKEHADMLNRAPANQQAANQQLLLQLQRQYGNGYVNQVVQLAQQNNKETPVTSIAKPVIQAKLAIGQVGDKYEQEADRTAHKVVQRMSEPGVEREAVAEEDQTAEVQQETDSTQIQKCGCNQKKNLVQMKPATDVLPSEDISEDLDDRDLIVQRKPATDVLPSEEVSEDLDDRDLMVQRKPSRGEMAASPDLDASIQRQLGKGQPLSAEIQKQMEQGFGQNFSGVRIHANTESDRLTRSIQARAFTVGQDIFFRQGEYAPGSKQGQELLAHELTHVIQQNGSSGVKSQEDLEVKVSESSQDIQLQRACSQCEQGKKEEQAEGIIQAKEAPGANPEAEASIEKCNGSTSESSEPQASGEQAKAYEEGYDGNGSEDNQTDDLDTGDCNQENSTDSNTDEEQNESEEKKCPSEEEEEGGTEPTEVSQDRSKLEESATCDTQVHRFILPVSNEFLIEPNPNQEQKDNNETTETENKPVLENTYQALTSVINPKDEATNNATETQGQLRTKEGQIARLASAQINFKLPKQAQTSDSNLAALEEQRATSSNMASNFFADAAFRARKITGLRQGIAGRINKATEKAKAAVLLTVQRQKAVVTTQINQQRTRVQNQAQATLAEIQNQHQITLANISQTTEATSQKIQTEYSKAFDRLDEEKGKLLVDIDRLYKNTYDNYIDAGEEIGEEAIEIGKEYEEEYLAEAEEERRDNQKFFHDIGNNSDNSQNWGTSANDGVDDFFEQIEHIEENRDNASRNAIEVSKSDKKAQTAREVAQQYQLQVKNEATKQANALANSKPEAVTGICCPITKIYKKLAKNEKETLNYLTDFQQSSVSEVTKVQTELTESVHQTLQTTLESLDEQENIQLQIVQGYGDLQIAVIEKDAQKAIATLENGVDQAATELLTALQNYYDEFQDMEAPHPDELSANLAEILGEFDSSIATVEGETEKGIAASVQGIQQGEQQVVGAVNEIAQSAIEEIGIVAKEAKNIFTNLTPGITDAFNSLQANYAEEANKFVENTTSGLTETTQGIGQSFNCIYTNIETNLEKSIPKLEESLWSILGCLRTDIENYAKKAIGEDEEWWQQLLKALVFVAVIVIGMLIAPLFAGLGVIFAIVLGAALGAALGALAQIANNAIDGKDLMKDVGDAAIMGAIGGAIGGIGGALGNKLGEAGKLGAGLDKSVAKYGIETTFDIVGELVGNWTVGEEITAQGILMGVVVGTIVHVSTTKLHGINKRAQVADTFNKNPDLVDKLPGMKGYEIDDFNDLAKYTGMDPRELHKLAQLEPGELKNYVEDAKQRTSKYDDWTGKKIKNFARSFENLQRREAEFGKRVASRVASPIKRFLPDTDVPMTKKEQEVLENTAPKRGDELTPEEWKTELEVAEKIEPKSASEKGFVEERELPNGHELKEKEDGSLCRASDNCVPMEGERQSVEPSPTQESGLGNLTTQLILSKNNRSQIEEVRIIGRPEKLFGNSMGDHTTAFAVHVGGVKVRLEGKNYQEAINGMNKLVKDLDDNLPGTKLVDSLPEAHKAKYKEAQKKLEEIQSKLTSDSKNTPKWSALQEYANAYLSWRELVPLSGINVYEIAPALAGKGKGEGVENLMKYERKDDPESFKNKAKKEILSNFDTDGVAIGIVEKAKMIDTLEKVAPGIKTNIPQEQMINDYVQQHMKSIKTNFPKISSQLLKTEELLELQSILKTEVETKLSEEYSKVISTYQQRLKSQHSKAQEDFNSMNFRFA